MPNTVSIDRSEPGVTTVTLEGEHETFSVLEIERAIDEAVSRGDAVVIDMTKTVFIDSSIMAILLRGREEAHVAGTKLALVIDDSTGWPVQRLFEVTGLRSVFPIAATREDALAV